MRVITGKYKGRHFDVPHSFKARPTTDFAKENLFNVLNGYIDFEGDAPTALDLFAGTGSITLELLSRGCRRVVAVEKEPLHCRLISQFLRQVDARNAVVLRADVLQYIRKMSQPATFTTEEPNAQPFFDIIFADPPYALPELTILPDLIFCVRKSGEEDAPTYAPMLREDGLMVLEHGKTQDFSAHPHFIGHRAYGSVNFSFFR